MSKLTQAQFKKAKEVEVEIDEIQEVLKIINGGGNTYRVVVESNGCGMSRDIAKHIGIKPFNDAKQDMIDALKAKQKELQREYDSYISNEGGA